MIVKNIVLENFAGIKNLNIDFDAHRTRIFGNNGTGKTTLYNAFTWLLTGKASTGAKNFTPKTENTHGLNHSVTATIDVNGKSRTIKRVFHEVYTKKRGSLKEEFSGHATDYYIDGVLTKEKDFTSFVEEITGDAEQVKALTMPTYFAEVMNWSDRRKILLEICGDVSDEDVINSSDELKPLSDMLGGHSVEEFIKIKKTEKSELNKQLDGIPARIDEAEKAATFELPDMSRDDIVKHRAELSTKIEELTATRNAGDDGYNAALNEQAKLKAHLDLLRVEHDGKILKAKVKADSERTAKLNEIKKLQDEVKSIEQFISVMNTALQSSKAQVEQYRNEYKTVKASKYDGSDVCPTCGQKLPADMIESAIKNFNKDKAEKIEHIIKVGKESSDMMKKLESDIAEKEAELAEKHVEIDKAENELSESPLNVEPIPKFEDTEEYKETMAKIEAINPVKVSSDADAKIASLKAELETYNGYIAAIDLTDKQKNRVEELKEEFKELSLKYEQAEIAVNLAEKFTRKKVAMLDERINGRFDTVKFRLFEEQVNGGIKDCCEVLVPCGDVFVPYSYANNASRINAGIEIISTLSRAWAVDIPVFVDNAEAITKLNVYDNQQIIELIVSGDDETLRVEY